MSVPTLRLLLGGSLVWVLYLGLFSLLVGPKVGETGSAPLLNFQMGTSLVMFLLLLGLLNTVTMRWMVFPQAERKKTIKTWQLGVTGLAFAVAPSVYGLVVVVLTRQQILALPFGALSVAGIALIYPCVERFVNASERP